MSKITCKECAGRGWHEYCVNPDNAHLDTQLWNLRYEKFDCKECNGTGYVKQEKK